MNSATYDGIGFVVRPIQLRNCLCAGSERNKPLRKGITIVNAPASFTAKLRMMRMQTYFFALFAPLALLCGGAYAQSPNNGNSCAQIADDAARLACFDETFQSAKEPEESRETAESVASRAEDVPQMPTAETLPDVAAENIDGADVESPPASRTVESATVERVRAESFGKVDKSPAPATTSEVSGTVQRVSKRARGEHVVYLENGQIWQENFASSYFPVDPGDTVVIKKRRFGGYRLVTESGKGFRVERVQ